MTDLNHSRSGKLMPTFEELLTTPDDPINGDGDPAEFHWTPARRRFANAFASSEGNLEEAVQAAGISEFQGKHLLTFRAIREAIKVAGSAQLEVYSESEATILQRLVNIAKGNIYDYFEPLEYQGQIPRLRPAEELTPAQKLRVKKLQIKQTRYGVEEIIELHDPMTANDRLAKYLGLDQDAESLTPEEFAARAMAAAQAMREANALDKKDEPA